MFKVEIIGNIGGDAEVKNDNGRKYVQFSVADSRKYKKEDGTEVEMTNWVSCFLRNPDSAVVPFLKKGTRVFVRGNGELRLFSSAKDRMMKPGLSINVAEVELVGGLASDEVPRELALPTGQLVGITKLYWIDVTKMQEKPTVMYDRRGNPYNIDANGFIYAPAKSTDQAPVDDTQVLQPKDPEPQISNDNGADPF